jgi:hypothetical protein
MTDLTYRGVMAMRGPELPGGEREAVSGSDGHDLLELGGRAKRADLLGEPRIFANGADEE